MPRSNAIWVVMRLHSAIPVAAFTVKHELITWLDRNNTACQHRVFRLLDNPLFFGMGEPEVREVTDELC
jgi:hypothetical protein